MTVLILGGTAEARALAELVQQAGLAFTSSLAGRVARPRLPVGPVRIGGFGGVDGLRGYLRDEPIQLVVDATHPFAEGMTRNAVAACAAEDVPLLRLERPGWAQTAPEEAASWHWVDSHAEAARVTAELSQRPFLTVGRQRLGEFTEALADHQALVRVVDAPDLELPAAWTLLTSRGPYTLAGERDLIAAHGLDAVVTKDSGGTWTWPKMAAASELDLPVVIVRRTPPPMGAGGDHVVHDPAEALSWLLARGAAAAS